MVVVVEAGSVELVTGMVEVGAFESALLEPGRLGLNELQFKNENRNTNTRTKLPALIQ